MKQKPEDIAQLEKKINTLQKEKTLGAKAPHNQYTTSASLGLRIATELLSGIIIGGGIGWFLDDFLHTKPYLLVVFLLFGGAAGFLNVYRFTKQLEQQKQKE